MKLVIIDPSSTEFNRGSFCYSPYLLYNGLKRRNLHAMIELFEAFKPEDLDKIPHDADFYIVTLWSYPQIETSLLLAQMLPYATGKDNVYFSGFMPFAKELGLQPVSDVLGYDPMQNEEFLLTAMQSYPDYYSHFDRLLLSDCDMHLKCKEHGARVHPLFTSFGCPNGCSFCPSTVNCGRQRIALSVDTVLSMLYSCLQKDVRYIHFTDEDFFYNTTRAYDILKWMKPGVFHTIALGSAHAVKRFIDRYGMQPIIDSGLEIIEIGFETADATVCAEMGGAKDVGICYELAEIQQKEAGLNIFWLVQTFFPGETISSLRETGKFMLKYGYNMDEVVGRLRTNGTKGGLGQFFQPYHGLSIFPDLHKNGLFLTDRPIRLIPSYIPNSFLNSVIQRSNLNAYPDVEPWLALYNIRWVPQQCIEGEPIRIYIENKPALEAMKGAIAMALYARMGVIE